MIDHPELQAPQDDDGLQGTAHDAHHAALAAWQAQPDAAGVLADIERFAEFAPLGDCAALAALFRKGDLAAERFVAGFVAAMARALLASPLGQLPLHHSTDGKTSTLLLACEGRVALTLIVTASAAVEPISAHTGVSFGPSESWEHVLVGRARAERIECCIAGATSALLERRSIELEPGSIVSLAADRQALRLREVDGCLISLRLERWNATTGTSREYNLHTGELIHQAAVNKRDSGVETAMAMRGRMGPGDTVPAMAVIARGDDRDALRWEALPQCLALDGGKGFAALSAIADAPDDPLAGPAQLLRAQLLSEHPELASAATCPG